MKKIVCPNCKSKIDEVKIYRSKMYSYKIGDKNAYEDTYFTKGEFVVICTECYMRIDDFEIEHDDIKYLA